MMTIAFIGFGEAGGILAADLAREHAVTIWDCKLNGPEREAMLSKARDSRVQVGNSLAQALERLALLWPDGKLTLPRVEQAVNDAAHFTPYHWVDALLAGKSKRVLHVLQQLRLEGCEPAILLRTLQRELLLLVTLKRQATHTPLRSLFDKHRVWQNRRQLLSDALTRLSGEQLRQAVTLLTRAELTFKQDYGHDVWPELESLSLLLCHKALADVFIDG
jgi:DNA polymerase-3 subunit delta